MSPSLRMPSLRVGIHRAPGEANAGPVEAFDAAPEAEAAEPTEPETAEPTEPEAASTRLDPARLAAGGFVPSDVLQDAESPAPGPGQGKERQPLPGLEPQLSTVEDAVARLVAFDEVVLSWIAADAYPMNVAIAIEVNPHDGIIRFDTPPGFQIPAGGQIALTGSHIRPLAGGGFDERSHVTVWGRPVPRPRGRFAIRAERAWIFDETETPLPIAYESSLPKARRYYEELSRERGFRIRPHMDLRLLLFRATRAPFLSATLVPVVLALALAAQVGIFDALTAALTLFGACALHLGLNVANDVFDTLSGADDANPTPTRFSGGSRVLQNAVISLGQMSLLAGACYAVAAAIGLVLLAMRPSTELVALAIVGLAISLGYTMPPVKLVYRGLGEVATAVGFGPVMLLGAYAVQSGGSLPVAAWILSVPVGCLVAMILYVNEIPDRRGDAMAGKRTLPVRWSKRGVLLGFDLAVVVAFAAVIGGTAFGALPIPCLLALLAVPLAREVHRGIDRCFEEPYALMPTMSLNIRLHLAVGLLLILGYLAALTDQELLALRPFFG